MWSFRHWVCSRLLLIGFIWLTFQAKKAGSQLKSRIVAEKPVAECAQLIEQLEDQISIIIREERLVSCFYALNFVTSMHNVDIYALTF